MLTVKDKSSSGSTLAADKPLVFSSFDFGLETLWVQITRKCVVQTQRKKQAAVLITLKTAHFQTWIF